MCNPYSVTKDQAAIIEITRARQRSRECNVFDRVVWDRTGLRSTKLGLRHMNSDIGNLRPETAG